MNGSELRLLDVKKKNVLMTSTYSIAMLSALALSLQEGTIIRSSIYGTELALFWILLFGLQRILHKPRMFAYIAVSMPIIGYGLLIYVEGGTLSGDLILLFLAVFSAVHLDRRIFATGYSLGLIALIASHTWSNAEQANLMGTLLSSMVLIYVLMGVILGVMVHLAGQTFKKLETILSSTEQERELQARQKEKLEKEATLIAENISRVNDQVQQNVQAQGEMKLAVQEVSAGGQSQSEQITDISAHAQSTMTTISTMKESLTVLQSETNQASDEINGGQERIYHLETEMNELRNVIHMLNDTFNILTGKIEETNQFTEDIQQITEQTNLLALNASIEAARAGEAGKGFSVVAEEIRKLAEVTGQSAKKITTNLGELNDSNAQALNQMKTGSQKLDESVGSMNEVVSSFERIQTSLRHVKERTDECNSISVDVEDRSRQVEAATSELAAIIEQASASMEEMSATIESLNDDSEKIGAYINETSKSAQQLISL
ncbi:MULTISPECIES: methyl-accepting chemotaxis protein [Pontibacillus]|uniref:Methyl-accepting chemotaxis protein n=1 Tax=Pontibacillus chungwhensis TaxID=265426 RepID=A0ABY8V1S7_9BACI|nr:MULTISPECIES: methyl-accepting chemotaxis protein [Pontibacillus]MCD5325430.1 methyl-accepting chemotaxis protein [Pontibacillus sp. HN14]WIF98545.1 methyl-accepting chemotaxis protein [Pontibacillus chungwhensis]